MMVRAAVTGAIDFSKAEPYNPQWMAYLRLVVMELIRESSIDIAKTLHQHYLALCTVTRIDDSGYKQLRDGANNLLDLIDAESYPWEKDKASQAQRDTAKAARQEWEEHYGELSDPAVQEAIDASVRAIREHRFREGVKRKANEAIMAGKRRGTRRERHRVSRMGNAKRT